METSASTGGPQAVFMATSAASNTYQTKKVETSNNDNADCVHYPPNPAPMHIEEGFIKKKRNKKESEQSGGQRLKKTLKRINSSVTTKLLT